VAPIVGRELLTSLSPMLRRVHGAPGTGAGVAGRPAAALHAELATSPTARASKHDSSLLISTVKQPIALAASTDDGATPPVNAAPSGAPAVPRAGAGAGRKQASAPTAADKAVAEAVRKAMVEAAAAAEHRHHKFLADHVAPAGEFARTSSAAAVALDLADLTGQGSHAQHARSPLALRAWLRYEVKERTARAVAEHDEGDMAALEAE
jgi:hypothetical protein